MKVSDLNKDIQNIKNQKPLSNENKDKLRNVLTNVFDVIEKFERNGVIDKNSTQKIDFLKDTIKSIIKDDDEKKIIRGE